MDGAGPSVLPPVVLTRPPSVPHHLLILIPLMLLLPLLLLRSISFPAASSSPPAPPPRRQTCASLAHHAAGGFLQELIDFGVHFWVELFDRLLGRLGDWCSGMRLYDLHCSILLNGTGEHLKLGMS